MAEVISYLYKHTPFVLGIQVLVIILLTGRYLVISGKIDLGWEKSETWQNKIWHSLNRRLRVAVPASLAMVVMLWWNPLELWPENISWFKENHPKLAWSLSFVVFGITLASEERATFRQMLATAMAGVWIWKFLSIPEVYKWLQLP